MDKITEDIEPIVKFKDGVALNDLLSEEGAIFEIKYDDLVTEENTSADVLDYTNLDCLGIEDEDTYNESEPFERLAQKMTDVIPNGKVKKRILRDGVGNGLPESGLVTCDYNAYIEYSPTPFDSTYARNKPFKLRLDAGQTIPGLELAIKSMKISEKSQFLIHPDLAYGKMGCLSRVPPNTEVLFEIEIKNCLNTGSTLSFANLSTEDQQSFKYVYEYAGALHKKGNSLFNKNLVRQAIKEYNTAVSKLESCKLADYNDQELQQELLLILYTNLVIAYNKIQVPRKACINANAIYHLVKGTSLKVPVKVYFHNARALMMIGDYDGAKQKLQIANKRAPNNAEIGAEFVQLEEMIKKNRERERKLARAIFKNVDNTKNDVSEEFKDTLKEYFKELIDDPVNTQYSLPDDLNETELNYVKVNAAQFNLVFGGKDGKHFIYKETINLD